MKSRKPKFNFAPKPTFTVTAKDGSVVKAGDSITDFRGESWTFEGCYHPRKICASKRSDWQQEFYPSVFDLEIKEVTPA